MIHSRYSKSKSTKPKKNRITASIFSFIGATDISASDPGFPQAPFLFQKPSAPIVSSAMPIAPKFTFSVDSSSEALFSSGSASSLSSSPPPFPAPSAPITIPTSTGEKDALKKENLSPDSSSGSSVSVSPVSPVSPEWFKPYRTKPSQVLDQTPGVSPPQDLPSTSIRKGIPRTKTSWTLSSQG